ncbi:hypothetical protein EJ04DRAFT_555700 [Polyplosphaeria fusca]|uniref:Rhodopsin domain-containing protein n=1 Tax=Polyplosphaeria fusca TaxID=682080 RepID=A0A9P4UYH1_9PLEO|nr:hypothetical protein EJ04DRAFT_555700 [Polyplosphaeria fusca]
MTVAFSQNNQGIRYFAICCVFHALAFVAVGLRLWSRRIQKYSLHLSDHAMLWALALTCANMVILGASVDAGMGQHIRNVDRPDVVRFVKFQIALSIIWAFSLFAIKASILDIYVKIFFQSRAFIRTCYACFALQAGWAIAQLLHIMLMCHPFAFNWDKSIPGAKINVFTVMRIAWRKRLFNSDATYARGLLFCLTLLEAQLGIALASIPAMQPAIRRIKELVARRRGCKRETSGRTNLIDCEGQVIASPAQDGGSDSDSVEPLRQPMMARSNSTIRSCLRSNGPGLSSEGVIRITQTWNIHESNVDLPTTGTPTFGRLPIFELEGDATFPPQEPSRSTSLRIHELGGREITYLDPSTVLPLLEPSETPLHGWQQLWPTLWSAKKASLKTLDPSDYPLLQKWQTREPSPNNSPSNPDSEAPSADPFLFLSPAALDLDNLTSGTSNLDLSTSPENEKQEETKDQGQDATQSYFFPPDPDVPNWKPVVLHAPYLLLMACVSLGLAGVQEYLCRLSMSQRGGLVHFSSLNQVSVSAYFLWRYFPTMVAVSYGIAYQAVDVETKRLEPYYRLAQRHGATVSESLSIDSANFLSWFRPPWPGSLRTVLSITVALLAVAAVPIVQNASLEVDASGDGVFVLRVNPAWSRALTATLGLVGVMTMALLIPLRHSTGLLCNPVGINSLLVMTTKSHLLNDFGGLDARSSDAEITQRTYRRRYILHKSSLWQGEYMAHAKAAPPKQSSHADEHPFTLPRSQGLPLWLALAILPALVPVLIFTPAHIVLEKVTFLMTGLAIILKLLWTQLDTNVRLTEPYYHLLRRNAGPDVLGIDYTGTVLFALPIKALRRGDHLLALVATNSILVEILTVCLSSFGSRGTQFRHRGSVASSDSVVQGDIETFRSFWISLGLSVIILMSLCVTAALLYAQRRGLSLPRKPGSLVFTLLIAHQSKMLYGLVDCEQLDHRQLQRHLENRGKKFGFGWYTGRDGELYCGLDEEPLHVSYKDRNAMPRAGFL